MARVILVLPTSSYRTADFVVAAERLGIELVVASEEPPPLDLGDRFVQVDCRHPDSSVAAMVELADHTPVDAVVAADDAGVLMAAMAAERLGLKHNSPEAAATTRDKLRMRSALARHEVPQPSFAPLTDDFAAEAAALGYPLVLKPRTANASRGVLRVDRPEDLAGAREVVEEIARAIGETGPLLAETYVPGVEVALEGMVVGGALTVLALFDKPDTPSGPTFEETLLVTPSTIPPETAGELERVVEAAVAAIGLTHGPIHAEAKVDGGRIYLLEVAARSIGGLCSRSLRFGLTGVSLEEVILAAALGTEPRAPRQPRPSGVAMLPVPRAGVYRGLDGFEEAMQVPGVTGIDLTVPPGTLVEPLPNGDRYLGFVFAAGATSAEVTEALRRATALLIPVID